jgi:hypothetical protein
MIIFGCFCIGIINVLCDKHVYLINYKTTSSLGNVTRMVDNCSNNDWKDWMFHNIFIFSHFEGL